MEFEGQFDDEEVLFFFRKHPVVLRKPLIAFLVIFMAGFAPLSFDPFSRFYQWLAIGGFIVGLLIFIYFWIGWYYSFVVVTNVRLIQDTQKGLFSKQVVEVDLNKIQSINYEVPGFQANIFKFGTLVVQTIVGDLVIDKIHHPGKIHKKISAILREYSGNEAVNEIIQ